MLTGPIHLRARRVLHMLMPVPVPGMYRACECLPACGTYRAYICTYICIQGPLPPPNALHICLQDPPPPAPDVCRACSCLPPRPLCAAHAYKDLASCSKHTARAQCIAHARMTDVVQSTQYMCPQDQYRTCVRPAMGGGAGIKLRSPSHSITSVLCPP